MKKLAESALNIGDIILTTTTKPSSKGIRAVTKSDISHAMVYAEAYSAIDSTIDGVHARSTQRLYWDEQCAVHVLRFNEGLTKDQEFKIISFMRERIGTRYSKAEAIRTVIGSRNHKTKKQFCSRLVAQAYASAGIQLVHSADYCLPAELKNSALLTVVEGATQTVAEDHINELNSIRDTSQMMRDATNRLLQKARAKFQHIENLNDIDSHLKESPQDDAFFVNLFRESGYLTVWEAEYQKYPWQYDLSQMTAASKQLKWIQQHCIDLLQIGESIPRRFEENLAAYSMLVDDFGLESFRLKKELHAKLVELHTLRRQVAFQWLTLHAPEALPSIKEPTIVEPHSHAWFAALAIWNPQQANHTRQIVNLAESSEVCSICGDAPTRGYRLIGHDVPDEAVHTLKLCNDCWKIRREMYGESMVLM